ncbi:hypothetical protein H6P81_000919 [Aristolochia fimbriata]|uniref:J domain-containing protein n=1 Tax=Aristolochia fimbriata TaxID=158543 RepID=A0AAV7F6Q4_ARIFI|nr:hypothetical protein H6P81_000919 [Aristolochia fimbriata]
MQGYVAGHCSLDSFGRLLGPRRGSFLLSVRAGCYGRSRNRWRDPFTSSAASEQDHYAVLGLTSHASPADIKRAYRLLARKYHPDVCKDMKAGEVFKSIRVAYEVLSNKRTRAQYDEAIQFQADTSDRWRRNWASTWEFDEGIRLYRWDELRERMKKERQNHQHESWKENFSSYSEADICEEIPDSDRGSFIEVLGSAFFTLFFMQTLGTRISLTICGLAALLDEQLDAGYKLGFFIAWVLGGQGGILLTMCLSFASWLCGKTSSSVVALVVVAMFIGTNVARFVPFPPGAVLTLLYMSIKLQVDLN